jgi:hypothetical protein
MNYKKFEDLPCWQKGRELCQAVFKLINKRKFKNDYSLKDQIWRAGGSTMDNTWPVKYNVLCLRFIRK